MKFRLFAIAMSALVLPWLMLTFDARADEIDDHFKTACAGLSTLFYSAGPKSDALDEEISKDIDADKAAATIVKRAQFIGSAQVCGQDTAAALAKLEGQAAAQYTKGSPKAKRFVQIVACIEARFERSAAAHWSNPDFCPQAKRNFDQYVVHEQGPALH
ncbi:MAG TPA: hypothetical protein VIF60_02540 [Burkholderiaceae bacterium]|jgi:hypothetical protein